MGVRVKSWTPPEELLIQLAGGNKVLQLLQPRVAAACKGLLVEAIRLNTACSCFAPLTASQSQAKPGSLLLIFSKETR